MAQRGNKGKPTVLKLISGTARADRMLPNQPEAFGDVGDAPAYLNELQASIWREVKGQAPAGLLTACDRNCFEGYVVLLAARVVALRGWNQTNNTLLLRSEQASTRHTGNPYLKHYKALTEQLRILETEFGFTPAARTRISLPTGEHVADPLAKFL